MAAPRGSFIYATLLLSDTYLPGALVLAHSLRDAGTTKELAVLVTLDTVSAEAITQLKNVYDHVIPVPRIQNDRPANLYLMDRPDLHSAFTKINLWKQTQFSKIVYIDADVVAYRAPDELFDIAAPFSAAPDIGWPDLFNTGVMVLAPNMGDYYAMMAMAERGVSFDGADQGLLNMHFGTNYKRLSFTYNVTPSAHYQYIPAYRHFRSSINMVHFIGAVKPWFQGRDKHMGDSPFDEMFGRWWAVYDRHYRAASTAPPPSQDVTGFSESAPAPIQARVPEIVQYFTKGEFQPALSHTPSTEQGATAHEERGLSQATTQVTAPEPAPAPPPAPTWDAQRQPPPADSKPEAINFPQQIYEMSRDPAPFVPPERYPSPPRDMWYEVPKDKPAPPTRQPAPLFPWEGHQPRPARVFTGTGAEAASEPAGTLSDISTTTGRTSEPVTPATPTIKISPSDPWSAFTRSNAWDEMPEIERYVEGLQGHRRTRSQGQGAAAGVSAGKKVAKDRGFRLTDFPSEVDRPSLPVTPAPIRRPRFWGSEGPETSHQGEDDKEPLPAAQGVPPQSDWDPAVQLQKLAKQQSEALLRKLGGDVDCEGGGFEGGVTREIPDRPLPFGSEGVIPSSSQTAQPQPSSRVVLSPRPVKGSTTTSRVRSMGRGGDEGDIPSQPVAEASHHGPGVVWEKGENVPSQETPVLSTEESRDISES